MNKITNLIATALCLLMVSLCACSSDNDDMYQFVDADNLAIIAFSPEQIIKNAGFKQGADGLEAPEGFDRLVGNNEAVKTLLKIKGIDVTNVLATADVANNNLAGAITLARVTNKKDVTAFLESEHYTKASEADGYDIYDINGSAMMLSDDLLVILDNTSADNAAAKLADIKAKAEKSPLKDWQKDVLNGTETFRCITNTGKMQMISGGGLDITKVLSKMSEKLYGVEPSAIRSITTGKLKGNTLEGNTKQCDADGKSLKLKVDCPKIDTSLLKYCHAGDQCIIMSSAAGLVDWQDLLAEVLGSSTQAAIVSNVLSDLDGTVMISGGVKNINEVMSEAKGFQITIAAQFKDAKKYVKQFEPLIAGQTTSYGDVKTVKLPGMPELSYTVDGKTLVLSVGAPLTDEGKKVFKDVDFSGNINVFSLRLPANDANVTMTPLPFSPVLTTVSGTNDGEFSLKLDGSDTPLLEQLIKFASQF